MRAAPGSSKGQPRSKSSSLNVGNQDKKIQAPKVKRILRFLFVKTLRSGKWLSCCGRLSEGSFSCYLLNLIDSGFFDCSQLFAGGLSMGGVRLIDGSKPDARERLRDYLRKHY